MIKVVCANCKKEFDLKQEGKLKDYEQCTMDCPHCGSVLIVENGEIMDFNSVLQGRYSEMGIKVDKDRDYTKDYIEFQEEAPARTNKLLVINKNPTFDAMRKAAEMFPNGAKVCYPPHREDFWCIVLDPATYDDELWTLITVDWKNMSEEEKKEIGWGPEEVDYDDNGHVIEAVMNGSRWDIVYCDENVFPYE